MKLFGKDLDREAVVVAEIGVNHEGSIESALNLLRLAAEAGADAAKFQSYTPARFASSDDPTRLERVKRFALDWPAHQKLAREAHSLGIGFFSTAVTEDWVEPLSTLCPAIKIASGDIDFAPVISAAANTGLPVILSTGTANLDEIDRAVGWFKNAAERSGKNSQLVLMQCVSAYPAPVEEANLLAIPLLAERYNVPVGFSNHVSGVEACHAAVALGAAVIETHFTDRREGRTFRDHQLSLEPHEFAHLVKSISVIRRCLGRREKRRQPSEMANLNVIRKGVVAARPLQAGATLGRDDLMYARPATRTPAAKLDTLVGRTLKRAIVFGGTIGAEDLA